MQSVFNPIIEFFHFKEQSLCVLFDPSGSSVDRHSQIITVPDFISNLNQEQYPPCLSIIAKNFSENVFGTKKIFLCEFFLVIDMEECTREYLIGKYQETVAGKNKGFFRRYHAFNKTIAEFEQEIVAKIADNFSYAWQHYIQNNSIANQNLLYPPKNYNSLSNFKAKFLGKSVNNNNVANISFIKLLLLSVILPILIIGTIWGISKSRTQDPMQQAIIDAIKTNPQAAQAQVDLTRETLKQMGLDAGKNGDVGCLATPQ